MLTDAARLQSGLDSKTGSRILPNWSRIQIQNKILRCFLWTPTKFVYIKLPPLFWIEYLVILDFCIYLANSLMICFSETADQKSFIYYAGVKKISKCSLKLHLSSGQVHPNFYLSHCQITLGIQGNNYNLTLHFFTCLSDIRWKFICLSWLKFYLSNCLIEKKLFETNHWMGVWHPLGTFIIPTFFKEKKGIMCYRSPSVSPSAIPSSQKILTLDLWIQKLAFMIHLNMLIIAMHIKINITGFWIYKNSSFCYITYRVLTLCP